MDSFADTFLKLVYLCEGLYEWYCYLGCLIFREQHSQLKKPPVDFFESFLCCWDVICKAGSS